MTVGDLHNYTRHEHAKVKNVGEQGNDSAAVDSEGKASHDDAKEKDLPSYRHSNGIARTISDLDLR